ncbi:putative uncharacterized protein [Pseudarthrobacter siccitolerans]|uniref:ABC-three component systems C-terminal domain-containing protein n=1 Tax=Pseudarthrobacter siccitolerans TaxID=861266 RepID=A0A024GY65_9MICC|nr:ABC-three component system protein [Pseudarthrobacter siccitolerans]CCQ44424.1 putative uncharacterized protein [Pseudarthrobacter siccitolerans]
MEFYERLALRPLFWAQLHELTGNAFEQFFHDYMCLTTPGFVDVRTHGNIGDLSSDGLSLHEKKLYACYAPESPNADAAIRKFKGDVAGALQKRHGQFETFVFVHNDVRGTHPEISQALAEARNDHSSLQFELMGMRHLRDGLGRLDRPDVESLLRLQLPLQHDVTMGLPEMEDLLGYLATQRVGGPDVVPAGAVSGKKLRYSQLSQETQTELRDAMKHSAVIEDYYEARIDVIERDEVAARFHAEYLDAAQEMPDDPEEVLFRLRKFLAGSSAARAAKYRAQTAILAFFFQTCDIFRNPPQDWQDHEYEVNTL